MVANLDSSITKAGTQGRDFLISVGMGLVPGVTVVNKFGHGLIGTDLVPVSAGLIYPTPQVSGATAVRVKAGNTNDTAAGTGAREITVQGLDETGAEKTEIIATAGTNASSNTTTTFIRIYRAWVSASGSYAGSGTGSHVAAIVIENAAGTEDWIQIPLEDFPRAQSECGASTIPLGHTAYITGWHISVLSTKTINLVLFKRENILETAAPYTAMRVLEDLVGIGGQVSRHFSVPVELPELTDIGIMGVVAAGSASVSADFTYLLVKNS